MTAPGQPSPSGTRPKKNRKAAPRQPYRRTSAIIDDRPDGKPVLFGYGRHLTRRERDRAHRLLAYAALGLVLLLCVGVLLATAFYNGYIYPNQTVASVNGVGISRHDRQVMTSYYTAAEAQATQQGAQASSLGDPQTLGVEQLQKSLLTKLAAKQKFGITTTMAAGTAQLNKELGSNQTNFNSLLSQYKISRADYVRLVEEPRVLEQEVGTYLTRSDPTTAPQWHYARISVKTQATADNILRQLLQGTSFAALAKKDSQDTQTASNGGDMGWERTTDGTDPLLAADFLPTLQKMLKSHTKYEVFKYSATVWYVLEFLGYDAKRPLSSTQQQADQVQAFNTWISPIQKTAIFDPPLPASTTGSTGGSSVTSPSSGTSTSSTTNGQL